MRYLPTLPLLTISVALLSAACGGDPSLDDALKRDLEAASAGSIELAPKGGQQVVSAMELTPQAKPVVTKTRRVPAPAPRPKPHNPQPAPASNEPTAPRPVSTPKVSPPPPGGYKTIDEVIRNAPFPIKP
jgi:hypothetical protein